MNIQTELQQQQLLHTSASMWNQTKMYHADSQQSLSVASKIPFAAKHTEKE